MSILQELIASLPDDAPTRSLLVGVHWTVVCIQHCGLAATLLDDHLPFIAKLLGQVHQLWVIERRPPKANTSPKRPPTYYRKRTLLPSLVRRSSIIPSIA